MLFLALGSLCSLISFVCWIIILIHAFTKGGALQGILAFCLWPYTIYYAFAKFEHPKKNQVILGYLVGGVLAGMFLVMGGVAMPHPVQ
jgi:hypothetical protein